MNSKNKLGLITKAASDKKAIDIVTIDMRKIPTISDWFVIAGGTSSTHVRAIADNIIKTLKEHKCRIWHSEGEREALWILLDCGDVACHVFYDQTRRFYDLERLWGDAPQAHYKEVAKRTIVHAKKRKKPSRGKAR